MGGRRGELGEEEEEADLFARRWPWRGGEKKFLNRFELDGIKTKV